MQKLNEKLYYQSIKMVEANSEIILAAALMLVDKVKHADDAGLEFKVSKEELSIHKGYREFFEKHLMH